MLPGALAGWLKQGPDPGLFTPRSSLSNGDAFGVVVWQEAVCLSCYCYSCVRGLSCCPCSLNNCKGLEVEKFVGWLLSTAQPVTPDPYVNYVLVKRTGDKPVLLAAVGVSEM